MKSFIVLIALALVATALATPEAEVQGRTYDEKAVSSPARDWQPAPKYITCAECNTYCYLLGYTYYQCGNGICICSN